MTASTVLNVIHSLKRLMKSEQAETGHIQGDFQQAAHWLQYVDSLLEGLTLLLDSVSFCSLPSSYPFICPFLCSAAASEASHTLIRHLSSAVSIRAAGKKRKPELIRGRKLIQRPKKKALQI